MFPVELVSAKEELVRFCASELLPSHIVISMTEAVRLQEQMPSSLQTFIVTEQSTWSDVYALDTSLTPSSVVIWAEDAIVRRWDSSRLFCNGCVNVFKTPKG